MKQFRFGISLCGAFVAGCIAATAATEATVPPARAGDTRAIEYTCRTIKVSESSKTQFVNILNEYGAQGWRVVPLEVGLGTVCFDRPAN